MAVYDSRGTLLGAFREEAVNHPYTPQFKEFA